MGRSIRISLDAVQMANTAMHKDSLCACTIFSSPAERWVQLGMHLGGAWNGDMHPSFVSSQCCMQRLMRRPLGLNMVIALMQCGWQTLVRALSRLNGHCTWKLSSPLSLMEEGSLPCWNTGTEEVAEGSMSREDNASGDLGGSCSCPKPSWASMACLLLSVSGRAGSAAALCACRFLSLQFSIRVQTANEVRGVFPPPSCYS